MGVGVPLSNPLGFKHHPLEGAGIMVDFHWGGVPASVKFFPTYVGRWQAFRAYVCIMYLLMFFGWVLVTCRLFANVATACLAWRWGGILSGSFGLRPLNDHSGRWCWRAKVRCVAKKNQVFQSDVGYRKVFARSKRYFEETGLFFFAFSFFCWPFFGQTILVDMILLNGPIFMFVQVMFGRKKQKCTSVSWASDIRMTVLGNWKARLADAKKYRWMLLCIMQDERGIHFLPPLFIVVWPADGKRQATKLRYMVCCW